MLIKCTMIVDTDRDGEFKDKTVADINKDLLEIVESEDGCISAKAELYEAKGA